MPVIIPPDWSKEIKIDEAINCLRLGKYQALVEKELLKACPNAYRSKIDSKIDPLSEPEYKLAVVWAKLSRKVRLILTDAYAVSRGDI